MRKSLWFRILGFALLALATAVIPAASYGQVAIGVSVRVGPPVIPVYEQPPCPEEGYLWTPGYWAYGDDGYYWVPGVWVRPPRVGVLWTPGYWGWNEGVYLWHGGYWGPHVGFYGGVNYGYGYGGEGFYGGEWRGGRYAYNTSVTRVNTTVIHNTYINNTYVRNTNVNRVSYNGGPGGISRRENEREVRYAHESHYQPTSQQLQHQTYARSNRANFASENHGRPANPAISRVGAREANQQGRVGQGVRSGQLTPNETRSIERREGNINREVHNDRAANGGKLTPQERAHVNEQQNRTSRQIYDDKHNARTDRPVQQQRSAERPQARPESHAAPHAEPHAAPHAEPHAQPHPESHKVERPREEHPHR